jgi:hypothetical protein
LVSSASGDVVYQIPRLLPKAMNAARLLPKPMRTLGYLCGSQFLLPKPMNVIHPPRKLVVHWHLHTMCCVPH